MSHGNPDLLARVEFLRRLAVVLGWAAVLVIVVSTLSPIEIRPHVPGMGPDLERFFAFLLAGALLCFAYPRQRWFVLLVIAVVALGLEWAQNFEATRHGRPHDAAVKVFGAALGAMIATAFDAVVERLRRTA